MSGKPFTAEDYRAAAKVIRANHPQNHLADDFDRRAEELENAARPYYWNITSKEMLYDLEGRYGMPERLKLLGTEYERVK
ncbi:hypothetical protein [Rhodococcus sp. 11-3]|uniref:hypothetical protein n=1 Tax=Rhodococcus sp. 11-3 TaxID=2854796 RepID=UPI00203CA105|nr:hypothetical protein [Rhodococcus sp. 11-3]USC17009.1 hypothetical protein KZJ41_09145 [Rhodococcus sp. 11-3]